MQYERPTPLLGIFSEGYEMNHSFDPKFPNRAQRVGDPLIRIFNEVDTSSSDHSVANSNRRLKMIVECTRKVLREGQVTIIVMAPYIVHWVTTQTQQVLGTDASDVNRIADALESKLGGPNSELVAEHVVRASTRAQLGIQNRNSIELRASSTKSYKADLDCYFDDPGLPAVIALLTPISESSKTGYEDAQLSQIRYYLGVSHPKPEARHNNHSSYNLGGRANDPNHHNHSSNIQAFFHQNPDSPNLDRGASKSSDTGESSDLDCRESEPDLQNRSMHDFIPSMMCRELEYFYAMLPDTAHGSYTHHELELARSQSIGEQEQQAMDPDDVDPHLLMRLNQQLSLSPVLPRRPRDIAEVQAEIERSRLLAKSVNLDHQHSSNHKKNGDIRCLECGTDTSPEWRKGPQGPKTLCNRCGLRFAKKLRMQK